MIERMRQNKAQRRRERSQREIEKIDQSEDQLNSLTRQYLRGEISLHEYNERCVEVHIPLDLRALAASMDRQKRRNDIDRFKRKVHVTVQKNLKKPA